MDWLKEIERYDCRQRQTKQAEFEARIIPASDIMESGSIDDVHAQNTRIRLDNNRTHRAQKKQTQNIE
jgi:hypothetical protein